jgi:hypothetical protein
MQVNTKMMLTALKGSKTVLIDQKLSLILFEPRF